MQKKSGISSIDTKLYYLDSINSVPYGHYKSLNS